MEEIVRCMDCGYCDVEPWGAWCNKENAQLNDACDEHKCDSFYLRIEKESSYSQLSKALCGKGNATLDEMLEAAEQLKHRAEPEMRPLTLEEVNANCVENSNSVLLYVEFWQVPTASRWIMIHEKDVTRNRNSVAIENYLKSKGQKYNILWRCWPRKPTPEQMAAEKWEE